MARKPFQASRPELVPAQGFEPWTIGLKARPDLRGTPPQGPLRIGFSAPRLSVAPPSIRGLAVRIGFKDGPKSANDLNAFINPAPSSVGGKDRGCIRNPPDGENECVRQPEGPVVTA